MVLSNKERLQYFVIAMLIYLEFNNRATAVTVAESEDNMKTLTVANNMIYSEILVE